MKKICKFMAITLALVVCLTGALSNVANAQIYFAGRYKNGKGKIELQQYSSPEPSAYGTNVGYAKFYGFKNKKKNCKVQLYEKSNNKYQDREGFITIKVKKKSVVVKGGKFDISACKTYSLKGTYKLKKRFHRP